MEKMTFENYRAFLMTLREAGYEFVTHEDYVKGNKPKLSFLLRHDVDFDKGLDKIIRLAEIEHELGIQSTLFFRLHDPDYNLLGYRELERFYRIKDLGHEIGLHAEPKDLESALRREDLRDLEILKRDKRILETILGAPIKGVAPHGELSDVNNLDTFKNLNVQEIGFEYQTYDPKVGLFDNVYYLSNFHGNQWKLYINGSLHEKGEKGFLTYADFFSKEKPSVIVCLIHPRPWYEKHYLL